ncbi:hypothetical protein C8Q77DRAFT_1075821 [Trametes polyzona]|nr:hypothetical protein C8Q77DRAFT_1075821 [Trametes polyzona]
MFTTYTPTYPTAYVYSLDPHSGALTATLMRVPGGRAPSSPLSSLPFASPDRVLPTLGKDTQGLIEEVLLRRGEVVYFLTPKAGAATTETDRGAESGSEKENGAPTGGVARAVRRAMRQVREVELLARRLEAEMFEEEMCGGAGGQRAVVEVADEDEDGDDEDDDDFEDEDEDEESDDEDDDEDESLWGDDDVSVLEECDVEDDVEDGESDEEWEEVETSGLAERAAELFGDEEDWEVTIFGRHEDEADHMDAIDDDKHEEKAPTDDDNGDDDLEEKAKVDTKPADDKKLTDDKKAVEEWTRPEDWDRPITPMASTDFDFDIFGFGYGSTTCATRAEDDRTATTTTTTTMIQQTRPVARAWGETKTMADAPRTTDYRMMADTPRIDARTPTRADADCIIANHSTRTDATRTQATPKPMVPMRTKAEGTPEVDAAKRTKTKTEPAPGVDSVQVTRVIKADITRMSDKKPEATSTSRGTKRKADDDVDDSARTVPAVADAIARTRTLAGLKFKKVKTCHSILTTEKNKTATTTTTTKAPASASATVAIRKSSAVDEQGRRRAIMKTGTKVRWCLDGDQELPPRKTDGLAGRKRKHGDDEKEDGELSDSDDDVPLAKRHRAMQVSKTSGPQRRWDDRRQAHVKATTSTTTTAIQRRPQMIASATKVAKIKRVGSWLKYWPRHQFATSLRKGFALNTTSSTI